MSSAAPEVACRAGATLGEGPFWSAGEQKLWFVDIKGQRIYRFDPETRRLENWPAPAQPGWVFAADDGRMVVGLQSGVHGFDPGTGRFTALVRPEPELPGNRLNDAAVDRKGRIWFGSMDDGEQAPSGHVYLYDAGRVSRAAIDACAITNGPALSPDGRTLYHVDTLARAIVAFAVAADGSLSNARAFASIEPGSGFPDGPTVDSAGCVWIGLYGGWGVRRYSPDGALLDFVRFPVANVTKIALGGGDLRTAYATTAAKDLSGEERVAQTHAGDLFAFRVDVPGLPTPQVRIGL